MPARFSLGQTVSTPCALAALTEAGQSPCEFLRRHISGDWGDVDERPLGHDLPWSSPDYLEVSMARSARPWFCVRTGWWKVWSGRKKVPLAKGRSHLKAC